VTTSGGYERFVEIEGRRYGHLIDPRTGWPVDGLLSVSVVASQAVVAGSIATVALLQPPAEGLDWLERCGAPYLAVDPQLRCHGDFVAGEGEGGESLDW
jgi:thiamine biosynthesis lipoprotein